MYKLSLFSNGVKVFTNSYTEQELYQQKADERILALYKHLENLYISIVEFE